MRLSYAFVMAQELGQGVHTAARHASARAVLYPNLYAWFILASALDILLTHSIVQQLGGAEVNTIADWFIRTFDWWGAIVLKFATVLFVVGVCEVAGQKDRKRGHALAVAAVVLGFFPVAVGLTQVARATILDRGELVAPDEFGGEVPKDIAQPVVELPPLKPTHRK